MNFLRTLSCLALCCVMEGQALDLAPQGGGTLKIDGVPYRFEVTDLSSAPPKGGLPGAIRLEGRLVPQGATQAFRLSLTVLKDGSLYMLRIERKAPGSYPDSWAATLKTIARAERLEDRPGGRIDIHCEGPLTGVVAGHPKNSSWSGSLWARFPGGGEE